MVIVQFWTIGVVPNHKIHRSVGLVAASDDVIESITVSNRGVKGGKLHEEYYVNKNNFDKVPLRNQKSFGFLLWSSWWRNSR